MIAAMIGIERDGGMKIVMVNLNMTFIGLTGTPDVGKTTVAKRKMHMGNHAIDGDSPGVGETAVEVAQQIVIALMKVIELLGALTNMPEANVAETKVGVILKVLNSGTIGKIVVVGEAVPDHLLGHPRRNDPKVQRLEDDTRLRPQEAR
jgi:hypothetical protein